MKIHHFPALDAGSIAETRNALQSYSQVLGGWLKACRGKRKHWWHASLRPSLTGLTTGVVHAGASFELELDLRKSLLHGRTSDGASFSEELHGQSAGELNRSIGHFLSGNGVDDNCVSAVGDFSDTEFRDYLAEQARNLAHVLNSVSGTMVEFQARVREETSPIQVWPHHFDLSMLWLPGEKIVGQDPENEENSDKQLNFGFTFGDEVIAEPYFYVTAYPLPDGFPSLRLPNGTSWLTEGFHGAVLRYRTLIESSDPGGYLLDLWDTLLSAAREQMLIGAS